MAVNNALRAGLTELLNGFDDEDLPIILDNQAYDNSILGLTDDNRLVYDYNKMIHEYAHDNKCSLEDAREWVDFNTLRSIPYMGERRPIVIMDSADLIKELGGY